MFNWLRNSPKSPNNGDFRDSIGTWGLIIHNILILLKVINFEWIAVPRGYDWLCYIQGNC